MLIKSQQSYQENLVQGFILRNLHCDKPEPSNRPRFSFHVCFTIAITFMDNRVHTSFGKLWKVIMPFSRTWDMALFFRN